VIPAEEMDPRIVEAFYRSLLESVKDSSLPMEPSDFLKNHLSEYTCAQFNLNLKFSSFKKIGRLLEHMDAEGVIEYTEPKHLGHRVIAKIRRDCPQLARFVPEYKLRREKQSVKQEIEECEFPKVKINEVFAAGKHLANLCK
jgi:hypothetical protein